MTFDHDAKSVATSLPNDYKPTLFTSSALQCSSVYLTFSLVCTFLRWSVFLRILQYF